MRTSRRWRSTFSTAERRGQLGHGLSRIEWLETWDALPIGRARRLVSEQGYELWDGEGTLGYLSLAAAVEAQLAAPPERARVVVCTRTFPTGALGYWAHKLAAGGLVAVLTATSPRRLPPPGGGPELAGTNPLAIAIPSGDGRPVVADVSMGAVTYGAVLAGLAEPGGARPVRRRRSRTRRSRSPSVCTCSSMRSRPTTASGRC